MICLWMYTIPMIHHDMFQGQIQLYPIHVWPEFTSYKSVK